MRVLQLVVVLVAVGLALYLVLRRRPDADESRPALRDELVKDPICGTYVVRSRAVSRVGLDGPVYFCSRACARRYATETRG